MTCASCGSENKPSARFCGRCGSALGRPCAACGAGVEPAELFCTQCGSPQPDADGTRRPTGWSAPATERRLVSVLFCDLVGFTALTEASDPEDARAQLGRYFDLAGEVVGRYGGTIEKLIGDAVMAVWGAPAAHEDDAERAVRAALDLVESVAALGEGIQARAAVMTGEAAVMVGAVGQGMVAGDLVNTASRLQSAAQPGTVLVGEATVAAADRAIAFEPAGERSLRGKMAPVAAWRALRVVAERGGRNRSEALEAPFVGRADELRLLKDLFHATSREGRARLVSVIGPAGIGKTRLAWEFEKYLDGLVENVWWHEGRSPAYGEGITFWALGEMVRRRCGLLEADDEATTRAKVAETLDRHVPDEADRRWIAPALLALLGLEATVASERLFGAWRTFFERLAVTSPVVMVFEDAHFADPGLLDFIDDLMEWSRTSPIYVVTLARPELLDRRPGWGATTRSFTTMHLDPLPESAVRELIVGLVPTLPEPAVRAIAARADGIPLYAIETVRMLVAEGRLRDEGGRLVPVGDLTSLAVPETLTALIASRLDALDQVDRGLIADAAVLGQSFTLDALAAVSGVSPSALEPSLRSLVRRELLRLEVDPRSPERGQYVFVQALIREVAYAMLARPDRKLRHQAAARYFESMATDELAAALAGHYLAARANAPEDEQDALAGQARDALRTAAERATALGSHEQAAALLEQGLAITDDPAGRAELLERLGEEAAAAGRYDVAEHRLQEAVDAWRSQGDRVSTARVLGVRGRVLIDTLRSPEAIGFLESAMTEFGDLQGTAPMVDAGAQLARAHLLTNDHRRAVAVADAILETAERQHLALTVADILVTKGMALAIIGRRVEGLGVLGAALELAETIGHGRTVVRAYNNRASVQAPVDPRAALDDARSGLLVARQVGDRMALSTIRLTAAEVGLRTGDWGWAIGELVASLEESPETSDRVATLSALVMLRACRGEPVAADLAELELAIGSSADPRGRSWAGTAAAFAAFADGRLAEARRSWHVVATNYDEFAFVSRMRAARAALWTRDATGAAEDLAAVEATPLQGAAAEADRVSVSAGIAALEGRTSEAIGAYLGALRAWADLGLAWDEALTGVDMAILLGSEHPEVMAAAARSRDILDRLRAAPFLDRIDAALAAPRRAPSADPVGR